MEVEAEGSGLGKEFSWITAGDARSQVWALGFSQDVEVRCETVVAVGENAELVFTNHWMAHV